MTMIDLKLERFLAEHGAHQTRHSGRSLYEHLTGTYKLLKDWGCDEGTCLGGLFHSIYGTRRFKHASLPISERDTVSKLIGYEAEVLAYLFCVVERPAAWKKAVETMEVHNTHQKNDWVLGADCLLGLLEIEAANLIEQKGGRFWLEWLAKQDIIATPVREAITQYLEEKDATQIGTITQDNLTEHRTGDQGGQAAEAGGGDRPA